jgi:hypothetical protein
MNLFARDVIAWVSTSLAPIEKYKLPSLIPVFGILAITRKIEQRLRGGGEIDE